MCYVWRVAERNGQKHGSKTENFLENSSFKTSYSLSVLTKNHVYSQNGGVSNCASGICADEHAPRGAPLGRGPCPLVRQQVVVFDAPRPDLVFATPGGQSVFDVILITRPHRAIAFSHDAWAAQVYLVDLAHVLHLVHTAHPTPCLPVIASSLGPIPDSGHVF